MSVGPSTCVRTTPTSLTASGAVSHGSSHHSALQESESAISIAAIGSSTRKPTTMSAAYSKRARSRPSRTASVRFPARRSVSMSRMLFTTRIAVTSRPTGTASAKDSQGQDSSCANVDPATATMPKKRNTKTSPRPS